MPDNVVASETDGGSTPWLSSNLKLRLISGAVLATVAFLLTYAGPLPFALLILVCALVISWEWGRLVRGATFDLGFFLHAIGVTAAIVLAAAGYAALGARRARHRRHHAHPALYRARRPAVGARRILRRPAGRGAAVAAQRRAVRLHGRAVRLRRRLVVRHGRLRRRAQHRRAQAVAARIAQQDLGGSCRRAHRRRRRRRGIRRARARGRRPCGSSSSGWRWPSSRRPATWRNWR